ncbi:anaerobic sulfatase maturase [Martelella sp. HB161492]|uniref:anaerobic sulfatase maturase n=1 Tax=Martelella sp. HB161492 TaxID=2720726 RepID=UPI0015906412|nr:anaerobic sulfatase maturase [Martelella sp. HB161492]
MDLTDTATDQQETFPSLDPDRYAAKGQAHRFHAMLKPSGAQCNLDCTYCFYLHKEGLLHQPKAPRMSDAVLEQHVRQYIEAQDGDEVVFSWQGGEPTLMGLDFFKKVVALQKRYAKPGQRIENDLQTNGVLLDEEWCRFLKDHNFLVGLSIDGPEHLHDLYRVNKAGRPSFQKVLAAAKRLKAYEVPFSALCVVNNANAEHPLEVYRFLRDEIQPRLIQFIPGMEKKDFFQTAPQHWDPNLLPRENAPAAQPGKSWSVVADWSVSPKQWGRFLNTIWDEWQERDFGKVFVDQFENILSMLLGRGSQQCVTSRICGKAVAVEHNGDVYSCDHFVYPEFKIGNILEQHEGNLAFGEKQMRFGFDKSKDLPKKCQQCRYLQLCWGHCPKDRFLKTSDGEAGLHYLCHGLQDFYGHVIKSCNDLVAR